MKKLAKQEVNDKLVNLKEWVNIDIAITREFVFKDFAAAVEFINKIAAVAEKLEHHPDILLHSWNKVKVYNSTHDVKGVTEKDIKLAEEIDKIV
jgi:4a-hydroxytetrahydrobiopterin dehydratase